MLIPLKRLDPMMGGYEAEVCICVNNEIGICWKVQSTKAPVGSTEPFLARFAPQVWRFTTESPGKGWNETSFDDSAWTEKQGGFGNATDRAGTLWTTDGIWTRRHFNPGKLSAAQLENMVADDMHLGDIQIYINGVLAYAQGRNSLLYEHRGLTKEARAAIKVASDNVLAVHCVRRENQQWVDAGLDLRIPQE
jgi:hypothetical protein